MKNVDRNTSNDNDANAVAGNICWQLDLNYVAEYVWCLKLDDSSIENIYFWVHFNNVKSYTT